jgi:hypothetical protein
VVEFTVTLAALAEPNLTALAPVNPVPVMVTAVPPVAGPLVGEMDDTVGAATSGSDDMIVPFSPTAT